MVLDNFSDVGQRRFLRIKKLNFHKETGKPRFLNVFIPTSPNPTSGMFVMIQESEARVLDMKVEEAVKLIISGGAVLPDVIEK